MMTIVQSQFESLQEMDGAFPGEALYLGARGVTTRPIPGRYCGTYISHNKHFASCWATLVLTHPSYLFRCTA